MDLKVDELRAALPGGARNTTRKHQTRSRPVRLPGGGDMFK